jgi:hypothetical protein
MQPCVQSTPKLKSRSQSVPTENSTDTEVVVPVSEHRTELKALLHLANSFGFTDLKKQ